MYCVVTEKLCIEREKREIGRMCACIEIEREREREREYVET